MRDSTKPPAPGAALRGCHRRRALATLGSAALVLAVPGIARAATLNLSQRANHLVLAKGARMLTLMAGSQPLAQYRVGLGFAPQGHKTSSGDGRTPEGRYMIDRRNARSEFYLSLGISYPDAADVARARKLGVRPGGDIFIHGEPIRAGNRAGSGRDWTAGCIAVTNAEIEEIWATVPNGTPITLLA